jgi:hypothetical protein
MTVHEFLPYCSVFDFPPLLGRFMRHTERELSYIRLETASQRRARERRAQLGIYFSSKPALDPGQMQGFQGRWQLGAKLTTNLL